VSPDFRSEPMESAEGKGVARRAWDAYARGVNRVGMPLVQPVIRRWSATQATDLIGFWVVWQLHGGFEGLEQLGMNRATIFRRIKRFRTAYGVHPDEFSVPGVKLNPRAYWDAGHTKAR
jgi:hypothetical protein